MCASTDPRYAGVELDTRAEHQDRDLEGIELESTGAFISTELLVKLRKNRKSIHQVGVQHLPRTAGKQTGANLRVIARAFRELFRLRGKLRERGAVPGAGSF